MKNFIRTNLILILVLTVSVLARLAAAFYLGDEVVSLPGTADQISYHNLALRVLGGHGFTFDKAWWPLTAAGEPTAHWSYLYTLYLFVVYAIFGPHPLVARIIQAVIVGLLMPYLAYRLAGQVCGSLAPREQARFDSEARVGRVSACIGQKVPLVAAGITAIYVYFIYYAAALMTESFYITGLVASMTIAISLAERISVPHFWRRAILLGLVLAATVLLRQLFLLFIPVLFLWLILASRQNRLRSLLSAAVAGAIVFLAILPFTVFNYTRFDQFVLLNTNAGYVIFWSNHPSYGTRFPSAAEMGDTYQRLVPDNLRHLDEAALDRALLKEGLQFVVEDPVRYVRLSLDRIPAYFKFWPDSNSGTLSNLSRVSSFALFLPFMIYGLLRPLLSIGRSSKIPLFNWPSATVTLLYLFVIIYTAIHVLSWAQIRYRLPVDAILLVFAALALVELGEFVIKLIRGGRSKATGSETSSVWAVDKS